MHKAMHKFFKKLIPNANQRSCVLMDIAIFLAKGRGQIYSRNLGVIEIVAAAEGAAVMMYKPGTNLAHRVLESTSYVYKTILVGY